jgi:hypothetical protein
LTGLLDAENLMSRQSLSCQSCGAPLTGAESQDHVKCEYCGAELTVLVAQRLEVREAAAIPDAILLAEPLSPPRQPPAPPPSPPAPERPARSQSESLDIPPWVGRMFFRAVRELFRRR